MVETLVSAGVNLLSTSPIYGTELYESQLGRILRRLPDAPMVSTKVHVRPGRYADMAEQIRHSVNQSRTRLGRDVIDAVLLHNRIGRERDPRADVLDVDDVLVPGGVADVLSGLVDSGVAYAVGITGLGHTDAIFEIVESKRFHVLLAYCNLLNPSATMAAHAAWRAQDYLEVANRAAALGMGVIGLRPLAGGALTNGASCSDHNEPELAADRVKARRFDFLVEDPSLLPRLAIRFALSQKSVDSVLVGARDLTDAADVLAAAEEGPLDEATMQAIADSYYDLFVTA